MSARYIEHANRVFDKFDERCRKAGIVCPTDSGGLLNWLDQVLKAREETLSQAQTADSLAALAESLSDALKKLLAALESLDDADAAVSNEEGPTDEQQDEVLDCVAQVEYHKDQARTALAEWEKTKGQG